MKKIAILGASGSIGTSALNVLKKHKEQFSLIAFSVYQNVSCIEEILYEFNEVKIISVKSLNDIEDLIMKYPHIQFYEQEEGLKKVVSSEVELVLNAIVGFAGLMPTYQAIMHHKDVALANKESLVVAGEILMPLARKNHVKIIPVDSEHSAIYQCLEKQNSPKKIVLTASGGPFFNKTLAELQDVSVEEALSHPTWKMGNKISIDSATMFNKAFEVIEAYHLFSLSPEQIEVLIHPQSIIHSLVEFKDGAIKAQLGVSDMQIPIAYALFNKKRLDGIASSLDLASIGVLKFYPADKERYLPLKLAYKVLQLKKTYPCVLNAANEEAVQLFLNHKISFLQIYDLVEETLNAHVCVQQKISLQDLILADEWARNYIRRKKL